MISYNNYKKKKKKKKIIIIKIIIIIIIIIDVAIQRKSNQCRLTVEVPVRFGVINMMASFKPGRACTANAG